MHIDNNIFCFNISFEFKRNWKNPFWVKYIKFFEFWNKQINKCYNLYYKLKGVQIVDPILRYKIRRLLESPDNESKVLGISILINCFAGTDLLDHCLYRMYDERDFYGPKEYFKIGKIQLHENTRIQEIIDGLKEEFESIPEGTSTGDILWKCHEYLSPLQYWMSYHSRIGSQCCSPEGEFEAPGGNAKPKLITGNNSFYDKIYTWDWRKHRYLYPIDVDKYWKTHQKPDLSDL